MTSPFFRRAFGLPKFPCISQATFTLLTFWLGCKLWPGRFLRRLTVFFFLLKNAYPPKAEIGGIGEKSRKIRENRNFSRDAFGCQDGPKMMYFGSLNHF